MHKTNDPKTYDSHGYTTKEDDVVEARAKEATRAATLRKELDAASTVAVTRDMADSRTAAQRADDVRDYERVKAAQESPVVRPPAPAPDMKAQIAMLHLLAEQLRNSAGDLVAVNAVVTRLKAAADSLLTTFATGSPAPETVAQLGVDVYGNAIPGVAAFRVDANGHRIDANGHRVDVNGIRVDATGNRVDSQGYLVDNAGHRVDASGFHLDANGNRIDSAGNRVDAAGFRVDSAGRPIVPPNKDTNR